jgi:hypothetical protein
MVVAAYGALGRADFSPALCSRRWNVQELREGTEAALSIGPAAILYTSKTCGYKPC